MDAAIHKATEEQTFFIDITEMGIHPSLLYKKAMILYAETIHRLRNIGSCVLSRKKS